MSKNDLYTITVSNWTKKNTDHKASYKKSLIDHRFCYDAKLLSVPMTSRWLFLAIVLECGNSGRDTVEMSSRVLRDLLECNRNIVRVLDELQSLQLLTYEKNAPLNKVKEKKGIEGVEVQKTEVVETVEVIKTSVRAKAPPSPTITISRVEDFGEFVPGEFWENWQKNYDAEFMKRKLVDMTSWLLANPQKNRRTMKGLTQFISGWFKRDWDKYQQGLPSKKVRSERL